MRFISLICVLLISLTASTQQYYLFVGTYTLGPSAGGSKGIYVYRFDAASGSLTPVSTIGTDNPSYLAIAPGGRFVYAVNETDGARPGGVSAFSFDKTTGQLKFINKQASGGDDPCYITVDSHRKWAMVANYSGGSLSALPIGPDGSLSPATETIQHTGTGPNKARQEKAHVHSTILSPDERLLLVCDLGTDKLSVVNFNPTATRTPLTPATDSVVRLQPGSGPRHSSFDPGKPYVYVIDELSGTVDAFNDAHEHFTQIQHLSSHPAGYKGDIGSADIHVAPDGRYLYASNRGDANNLAIFAIDSSSGKLTIKGFQSTLGKMPRNFVIDPSGRWLLAANQGTGNVVVFRIDPHTGLPKPTGKQIAVPAAVCLKLEPAQ
jgi:6-phosphogluconolactonase